MRLHMLVTKRFLLPQGAADLSNLQCGRPFNLEIEALDAHNNRCVLTAGPVPTPRVVPQSEEGPLVYDEAGWKQGWGNTQVGTGWT